jgi:hypothetical protein
MDVGSATRARCPSNEGRLSLSTGGAPASPGWSCRWSGGIGGPRRGSCRLDDCPSRLDFVWVRPVPRRHVLERHMESSVLALPDVAELVRQEVVGSGWAAEQDRLPECVAAVAAEPGYAEEPWRDPDSDALDSHRLGVVVERVEAGLCPSDRGYERRIGGHRARSCAREERSRAQPPSAGVSTSTGLPSCACR